MLLTMKIFFKKFFFYISHVKKVYPGPIRIILVSFLFFSGILYFTVADFSLSIVRYLWIEILFFVILVFILLYAGILYCFTTLKNNEISSEILNLLLVLHFSALISFIFFGIHFDFIYGTKIFLFNNYYMIDFYNYTIKV
jgi:hypothetical protein